MSQTDDNYLADDQQQEEVAQSFYQRDYTKKWPGLTLKRAKELGDEIGVDWDLVDLGQFIEGIKEEMEHGTEYGPVAQVHADDYATSARITYAHLIERPDYYTALKLMENEGDEKFSESDAAKKRWVADQRAKYQAQWDAVAK